MKASVGRICEGEGVQYAQQSALNLLMHLAIDHVTKVSSGARENAEASGRMIVNVADVAMSLIEAGEELNELREFVDDTKSKSNLKPLAQVPRFPVYPATVLPPLVCDTCSSRTSYDVQHLELLMYLIHSLLFSR